MLRHLRSLHALLAFEAAGRHRSIKKAGAELHVTPSAISRQIRMLEEDLGTPLFRRLHRGLELSDAGTSYLADVRKALGTLEHATLALRAAGESRPLRISALHGFAANWLVPRLPRFEAAHPDVEIRLETATTYADLRRDEADLAIRFGTGPWRGLHADRLLDLDLFPVCRPSLSRGSKRLLEPRDLAKHTWLEDVRVPDAWTRWLKAAGVEGLRPRRFRRYDNAQLALEAAVAGLGVTLSADVLAEPHLRARRLVRLFSIAYRSPQTYHLVARAEDLEHPRIGAFRTWLFAEMAAWHRRTRAPARLRRGKPSVRKLRSSSIGRRR